MDHGAVLARALADQLVDRICLEHLARNRDQDGAACHAHIARFSLKLDLVGNDAQVQAGIEQAIDGARCVELRPVDDVGDAGVGGRFVRGDTCRHLIPDRVLPEGARAQRGVVKVVSQRLGPAGHVVEGGLVLDHASLEQAFDDAVIRLCQGHDIGLAGLIAHAGGGHGPVQFEDIDPVVGQQVEEGGEAPLVVRGEDVGVGRILTGQTQAFAEKGLLVVQQILAPCVAGPDERDGGACLLTDLVVIAQRAAFGVLDDAADRALLEQVGHAAEQARIAGAIAQVEVVEPFLGDIERPFGAELLVEQLVHLEIELQSGLAEKRVKAVHRSWRDEEGGVAAHLVQVRGDVGHPVMGCVHECGSFGLGHGQPLAVQVEPVMIGPPPRPGAGVLAMLGVGNRSLGMMDVHVVGKAARPVRIDQDDLVDHRGFEQSLDFLALCCGEEVEQGRAGIVAGRLGSVHAVGHLDDDRGLLGDFSRAAGVRERQMSLANLLQPGLIGRGGGGHAKDGTSEVGPPDHLDADSVGGGRYGAGITMEHFRRGDDFPGRKAGHILRLGDGAVIGDVLREQVFNRARRVGLGLRTHTDTHGRGGGQQTIEHCLSPGSDVP